MPNTKELILYFLVFLLGLALLSMNFWLIQNLNLQLQGITKLIYTFQNILLGSGSFLLACYGFLKMLTHTKE